MNFFFIACGVAAVASAGAATFIGNIRRAIISLWICGLMVGGLFLSLGAEVLAIVQWIVATLGALAFMFYAVMFGEKEHEDKRPVKQRVLVSILPILIGVGFTLLVWSGTQSQISNSAEMIISEPPQNASVLGISISENHFLSLEVLAIMLFLAIVGTGVMARSDEGDQS